MLPVPLPTGDAPALQLDTHPAYVYLSRLAVRSQRTQRGALETLARILSAGACGMDGLPWHELRYQHTQALRAQLAGRYATATSNRMLAALRGVLQECWRLGLVDAETYRRAADIAPVRGTPAPHGRALDRAELTALIEACAADTGAAGRRDAALIGLLYACGLRRSEAVALDVADLRRDELLVRKGKGGKARRCFIADDMAQLVVTWRDVLAPVLAQGPLFVRIIRHGIITPHRISDQAVRLILARRCEQAGVEVIAPHSLRRTHVSLLLQEGVDIATVAKMVGHSSVVTTQKYDRRGDEQMRLAAATLTLS